MCVSLTGLRLAYDKWNACPPRAGMGRHDAPYGTYDHLVLLLGRVADFAARDQGRKRKAMEGRFGPSPPASSQAPPAGAPSATAPPPMMYGMVPPRGPAKAPRGFEQEDQPSPASSASDQIELEMATAEAEAEWHELEHAMQLFRGFLGPHFQPLAADLMQPLSTPFGPAVYYKTSTIACLWITIYMGLIVLHRAHPSMPPAAMMAAGMAARTTAPFATHVGRITAGAAAHPRIIADQPLARRGAHRMHGALLLRRSAAPGPGAARLDRNQASRDRASYGLGDLPSYRCGMRDSVGAHGSGRTWSPIYSDLGHAGPEYARRPTHHRRLASSQGKHRPSLRDGAAGHQSPPGAGYLGRRRGPGKAWDRREVIGVRVSLRRGRGWVEGWTLGVGHVKLGWGGEAGYRPMLLFTLRWTQFRDTRWTARGWDGMGWDGMGWDGIDLGRRRSGLAMVAKRRVT